MTGKDQRHTQAEHHAAAKRHAPRHPSHHATRGDAQYAAALGPGRKRWGHVRRGLIRFAQRPRVRQVFWGTTLGFALVVVATLGLWWRLSSGPIEIPMATPWLKAAIEQNFGGNRTVSVGGTQIERGADGRTSLRLRDIILRDADGTVVASAPKAEVGISGASLLTGKVRAQSLNLVGAEMSVRIESDGTITVFAGADNRPLATAASPAGAAAPRPSGSTAEPTPLGAGFENLAGALAWIDALGASGLDGYDLRELGLKDGNLTVDDQRNGKHWSFSHIDVSLRRPQQGGVVFRVTSENPEQPWDLSAAMRPLGDGARALGIEARKVSARDLLLALRLDQGDIESDLPLSASVRAEIAADGTPRVLQGQLLAEAGSIIDRNNRDVRVDIDRAEFRFNWDVQRRMLVIPFQVQSAGNQFTMRATLEPPSDQSGVWVVGVTRDDAVIDPVILAAAGDDEAFALNRAAARMRIDMVRKRIELEQGDFSRIDTRPSHNIGIAVTGSFDYSGPEPRLAFGVAGTRMPASVMKRLWPVFAAYEVRQWVETRVSGGMIERVVVAGNAPLPDFKHGGPPMPDEGLSVEMETSGTTLRPVDTLPAIRDADLTVRVTGQTANVSLGRGTVVLSAGRKLSVTGGVFTIADTHPKPASARTTLRIDGTVPAAAELLASDALRGGGLTLDATSSRGTVTAQVVVNLLVGKAVPKNSATYAVSADLTNFSADKLLIGQKVEAALLRVNATRDGYEAKGDVKINGTPANMVFRQVTGEPDGDLRLQATIDEAARVRLGIDLGPAVTGAIPLVVTGRAGGDEANERMTVDADLTPVRIDNLLPGWVKPVGRVARATYTLVKTAKSTRFDDLIVEGSGASVKGSVEFDSTSKDVISANFPVFGFSDGDRGTLKADRGTDGVLRVVMRGDVFDGGNFVKSMLAGESDKSKRKATDLDLDLKLGTVIGRNGETLRGLDLKMGRRNGRIRSFLMNAKVGSDSPLNGDLRLRARDGHQVLYFETDDAGALFRFTDMYPRMQGGQMWIAMDPPSQDTAPQQGTLFIRNFIVRGEPGLERVVASGPPNLPQSGVQFTELSCEFTKITGRMAIRDGVVRGPAVGATIEGQIDYVRDDVHLQGTFVPFYGLNNMFGQLPILGPFFGGSKEGLLGINYDAVGPPSSPRITVNPGSAIAPGLLRKFFPSPGSLDRNFMPPSR